MSIEMNEEIKRWTAKRKSALVMEIIQGKKTVAEASRQFDLPQREPVTAEVPGVPGFRHHPDQAPGGAQGAASGAP